jgi:hypothetical protein
MGGLGNVLFQINYAYKLREIGYNVIVNTYLLRRDNFVSRYLQWTNHETESQLAKLNLISDFKCDKKFRLSIIFGGLSKKFNKKIFDAKFFGLSTPFDQDISKIKNVFGYFHNDNFINEKFSEKIKSSLIEWTKDRDRLISLINEFKKNSALVVHVRGGDFDVNSDSRLGLSYYKKLMLKSCNVERPTYVITNDMKFANEVLHGLKYEIISLDDTLDEFIILMEAPVKILANSTFSWWAAELSSKECTIYEIFPYYPTLDWRPKSMHQRICIDRN